jgi:hypothetical protein
MSVDMLLAGRLRQHGWYAHGPRGIPLQETPLDQYGDHPHTNFRALYNTLTDAGYYVEVLGMRTTTCRNAK